MSFFDIPGLDLPSPRRVRRGLARAGRYTGRQAARPVRAVGREVAEPVRESAAEVRRIVTQLDKAIFGGGGIQENLRKLRKAIRQGQRGRQ